MGDVKTTEADQERDALRKPPTRVESSSDVVKTNDPVRMYLRKMGSVSLLTREGEIEIAMRIEEGELEVLDVLLDTNYAIEFMLAFEERIRNEEVNVRDVVKDLDGAPPLMPAICQGFRPIVHSPVHRYFLSTRHGTARRGHHGATRHGATWC